MTVERIDRGSHPTILYLHITDSGFVRRDEEILSSEFHVVPHRFEEYGMLARSFMAQLSFLARHIRSCDAIVIQFGGYHSLLPVIFGRLFNRRSSIICHGTDCCSLPSIDYGRFRKWLLRNFLIMSYRSSDLLLPVSESCIDVYNRFVLREEESHQGILRFIPRLKTPYHVVSNGLPIGVWNRTTVERNTKGYLTVISNGGNGQLKGLDLIFEVHRRHPDCIFHVAGIHAPEGMDHSDNLVFHGPMSAEGLRTLYSSNTYYLQLSLWEGFGLALCESMLCEMTPIVSSINILPTIVGDTGHVLERRNIDDLSSLIDKTKGMHTRPNSEARERIIERYSIQQRKMDLVRLTKSLLT